MWFLFTVTYTRRSLVCIVLNIIILEGFSKFDLKYNTATSNSIYFCYFSVAVQSYVQRVQYRSTFSRLAWQFETNNGLLTKVVGRLERFWLLIGFKRRIIILLKLFKVINHLLRLKLSYNFGTRNTQEQKMSNF